MRIDKKYVDEVKRINRGLDIVWDDRRYRWRVIHKDDRTGLVRDVFLVEGEDGEYRDLDMGVVRMLKDSVLWDLVDRYPDPKDMYLHVLKEYNARKAHYELERMAYLREWNRHHRKEWKDAIENARSGVWHRPCTAKDKKIIIT